MRAQGDIGGLLNTAFRFGKYHNFNLNSKAVFDAIFTTQKTLD